MKISHWSNDRSNASGRRSEFIPTVVAFLLVSLCQARAQLVWNTLICSNNVPPARSVQSEYYFTNKSPTAVRVIRVYSDCGCLIAERPANPVEPGGWGKIVMKMDVAAETGVIKKTAHVITDDPHSAAFTLTNIVNIPEIVVFSPLSLTFNRTNPAEQVVTFSNILNGPIRIQSVTYGCECDKPVQAIVDKKEPRREVRLRVKPPAAAKPYDINFDVVVQQHLTGIEKHYRFKATIK